MPPFISTSRTRAVYERHPQGPVVLNEASWQAQNLVGFWPLGLDTPASMLDYSPRVAPNNLTINGTRGIGRTDQGQAVGWSNNADGANFLLGTSPISNALPATLATWALPADNVTTFSLVNVSNAAGSGYLSLVLDGNNEYGFNDQIVADANGGATNAGHSVATYTAGVPLHAVALFTSTTSRNAALNGILGTANTNSRTTTTWPNVSVGAFRTTSPAATFGPLSGVQWHTCIWNRGFTALEIYNLWEPKWRWDLCYVLRRRAYSFKPVGGSTYDVSVTETATGTDTPTNTATLSNSLSETNTGTDTSVPAVTTQNSVGETVSPADLPSSSVLYSSSFVETNIATDTVLSAAVFTSSTLETNTGTDTISTTAVFARSVAESVSTLDIPTSSAVFNSTDTESVTSLDTVLCAVVFTSSLTETVISTDTVSNGSIYTLSVSESSSTTDIPTTTVVVLTSVGETVSLTDLPTTSIIYSSSFVETNTALDFVTPSVVISRDVSETGALVDLVTCVVVFNVTMTESVVTVDTITATSGGGGLLLYRRRYLSLEVQS